MDALTASCVAPMAKGDGLPPVGGLASLGLGGRAGGKAGAGRLGREGSPCFKASEKEMEGLPLIPGETGFDFTSELGTSLIGARAD